MFMSQVIARAKIKGHIELNIERNSSQAKILVKQFQILKESKNEKKQKERTETPGQKQNVSLYYGDT